MQIYIAKPGGQKEGPFTVEQINRDLANNRFRESEYWAWYEGLPQWMPLHSIPGVNPQLQQETFTPPVPAVSQPRRQAATGQSIADVFTQKAAGKVTPTVRATPTPAKVSPSPTPTPAAKPAPAPSPVAAASPTATATGSVVFQAARATGQSKEEFASGLPFPALEQIFIFTSGEGQAVFDSSVITQKLQDAVGEALTSIRGKIPVSVIGRADVGVEIMLEGSIPEKAWRAMSAIKPAVAQKAKDELFQICIRTFSVEARDSVALFLLYNKEKMQLAEV